MRTANSDIEGFETFMGNFGGVVAAIVGVVLAGLTVVTAVNVSQPENPNDMSHEELVDYDNR